jgi:hypothetical protein
VFAYEATIMANNFAENLKHLPKMIRKYVWNRIRMADEPPSARVREGRVVDLRTRKYNRIRKDVAEEAGINFENYLSKKTVHAIEYDR